MMMPVVNPTDVDPAVIEAETARLINEFPIGPLSPVSHADGSTSTSDSVLASLYIQHHTSSAHPDSTVPVTHLAGVVTVTETLCGLSFAISPQSFFQVNTLATEVLYTKVRDLVLQGCGGDGSNVTLLDVCCGTGTIGLTLAKHVKRVIGVDIVEAAIVDAKANAAANGITNAEFIAGSAESVLPSLVSSLSGRVVAVVDPPRPGLHPGSDSCVLPNAKSCCLYRRIICNHDVV